MKRTTVLFFFCVLLTVNGLAQMSNCEVCSERLLTEEDVEGKSLEELSLLRNEIYARKGYTFQNARYDWYFSDQDWYSSAQLNSKVKLSDIEAKNVEFLKKREQEIQRIRDLALADLKEIKRALNDNDQNIIDKYLTGLKIEEQRYKQSFSVDFFSDLKSIINRLDLNDIHWNRGRGLYAVQIDNGYSISRYSIEIEDDVIRIGMSDPMSHSENFGDFGDGYSDYMSESESSMYFVFEMTDTGIVYQNLIIAG